MGGEYQDFKGVKCKKASVYDQFSVIQEQEAWESGHGGYTGTFAEKPNIRIITNPGEGYWTVEAAKEHCLEENDKWGDAYAYETGKDEWYFGGWCSS